MHLRTANFWTLLSDKFLNSKLQLLKYKKHLKFWNGWVMKLSRNVDMCYSITKFYGNFCKKKNILSVYQFHTDISRVRAILSFHFPSFPSFFIVRRRFSIDTMRPHNRRLAKPTSCTIVTWITKASAVIMRRSRRWVASRRGDATRGNARARPRYLPCAHTRKQRRLQRRHTTHAIPRSEMRISAVCLLLGLCFGPVYVVFPAVFYFATRYSVRSSPCLFRAFFFFLFLANTRSRSQRDGRRSSIRVKHKNLHRSSVRRAWPASLLRRIEETVNNNKNVGSRHPETRRSTSFTA